MKLYLSGGGSGKQNLMAYNSYFSSIDKNKEILYIPLAMDEKRYPGCFEWFKKEISYFGFSLFYMVTSSKELSELDFNNYSSIFIGGGNTFKLLKELKSYSLIDKIKDYLITGGIVYGGSAGAIIFGNNIDTCSLMDDNSIINLKDKAGFNFLNNISILCHYNNVNFNNNKEFLLGKSKDEKILFIPEEDVILITQNCVKFIGEKKYCMIKDGKYYYHNFANFKKDIIL